MLLDDLFFFVETDTEVDECEHGNVHEDTLDKQRRLVMLAEPKEDPQSICDQQRQANVRREALK